jgi:hypothetical protein
VTQEQVAEACGVSGPAVNQWLVRGGGIHDQKRPFSCDVPMLVARVFLAVGLVHSRPADL